MRRVLRDEVGGSSEETAWLPVADALGLPLAPFVGELIETATE